jgi:hypothetical protein
MPTHCYRKCFKLPKQLRSKFDIRFAVLIADLDNRGFRFPIALKAQLTAFLT